MYYRIRFAAGIYKDKTMDDKLIFSLFIINKINPSVVIYYWLKILDTGSFETTCHVLINVPKVLSQHNAILKLLVPVNFTVKDLERQ